ncbi:MAG: leucyl aminopeptidase family protein, partial [Sphingomonadaceae bacterium]
AGAAAAMGGALAVARRAAPVNLVAVAALAENMPDGNAQRPGDVVRTMNGKTIEVLNTDAEGRLVLVDANQYVIDRYKPAAVVNIATLTGSIVQALDDEFTGMFARDEDLARRLQAAADASGEAVWRMPLHPNYARDMASDIADIKNVVEGGGPGASLAAHFLSFLTPEPTPWGHLDIAGTALGSEVRPTTPKGPTGVGVRLFNELARGFERR